MRRTVLSKRIFSAIIAGALLIGLCAPAGDGLTVYAKDSSPVVLTGLTTAGEDSINVGIQGTYLAGQKEALDRINEIRQEACAKGYPDPRNRERALTMDDYVPIKWSSDLEKYARIRAAEAVVYPDHSRPGSNVYIDQNDRYITGNAEVLAWPGGTLKGGVNQWYGEKDTWVKQAEGVTGHYTSMINPNNTYVGLGGFMVNESGLGSGWDGCVSGRFMRGGSQGVQEMDETMAPEIKNAIQVISIKQEYVSEPELKDISGISSSGILYQGDAPTYAVVRQAKFPATAIDVEKAVVLDMDSYTFSSSNSAVLSVDTYGKARALKVGSAVVTAKGAGGAVYQKTFKVKSYMKTPKLSKLTSGKKQLKVQFTVTKDTVFNSSGFQVQIASDSKFKKIVKNRNMNPQYKYWSPVTSYTTTVKKLKTGKDYYVRVRAYVKVDGKKYYSNWSKVKKKRI